MKRTSQQLHQIMAWLRRVQAGPTKTGPADQDHSGGDTTKVFRRQRRAGRRWVLEVIAGIDQGRSYPVYAAEFRIGRQAENHIQLQDPKVSRFHALIRQHGSRLLLSDAQSTNGTRVNLQLITEEYRLAPGDQIVIGETILQVRLESTEGQK